MRCLEKIIETAKEFVKTPSSPKEEWVWVEGYKGTDKNMCCRGFSVLYYKEN